MCIRITSKSLKYLPFKGNLNSDKQNRVPDNGLLRALHDGLTFGPCH